MPAEQWTLYVDESGRFEEPDRDSVVSGLLVEGWVPDHRERRLRDVLERATAGLAWPPHAWTLRDGARLRACVSNAEARFSPAQARHCATWDEATWDAVAARYRDGVASALRALPELVGARAWAVGALCDLDGSRRPGTYGHLAADGYLETLAALLVRVALLVRPPPGGCAVVRLHVATRRVRLARLDDEVPFVIGLVKQLAYAALRGLPPDLGVGFTVPRQERFDTRAHPGLVAADTVSNTLFADRSRPLRGGLERLRELAHRCWSLPVEIDGRATFTAAGPAHEAVVAGTRGEGAHCPDDPRHPWVREQALCWPGVR